MSQLSRIRNIGIIWHVYDGKHACTVQLYDIKNRWRKLARAYVMRVRYLNELRLRSEIYRSIFVRRYNCTKMTDLGIFKASCTFFDDKESFLRCTIETNYEIKAIEAANQDSCNGRFTKTREYLIERNRKIFWGILQRLTYQRKPPNSILIPESNCALWRLKQIAQCVYA